MLQDYKKLELLVAKIQQQLAPKSKISHNVRLDGRLSRRKRQIDVLIEDKIGQYEMKIVIDCKDYKHPADVKDVEEFDGLLRDVGAQKGVLVCPKGFSSAAKTRAEGLQIDLYSPVDTDPHKWKVSVTIPATVDFRKAIFSFRISCSVPLPLCLPQDFERSVTIYNRAKKPVGKPLELALAKWKAGDFPVELGEHESLSLLDNPEVIIDNGYGQLIPVNFTTSVLVERELYFGQPPVPRISGFKDEFSGKVISNIFEIGLVSPEEIEQNWKLIEKEEDAPIRPVIMLRGIMYYVEKQ